LKAFTPFHFDEAIVSPATGAILAESVEIHLHLFPSEFSTILMLSIITITGGFGLYFARDPLCRLVSPANAITKVGPEQWYYWTLDGMMGLAKLQTRILQSGYLRYYLLTVIGTTVIVAGYTLFTAGELGSRTLWAQPQVEIYELLVYLTILAATIMVVITQSRLAAVAALGVVGYGVALIFIFFGAPDLAMTQFSIETLSVILLVLVLYRLPTFSIFSSRGSKTRDAIAALLGGALLTVLVLVVTQLPAQSRLTPYFAENSVTKAKGHNVVNVILVDFRGFDTMGEITVLSVAAIGVFGLMKLRLEQKKGSKLPTLPPDSRDNTDIYPTLTKTEQP
jgi:multicomponent Na+:H+ antiporter subunit A